MKVTLMGLSTGNVAVEDDGMKTLEDLDKFDVENHPIERYEGDLDPYRTAYSVSKSEDEYGLELTIETEDGTVTIDPVKEAKIQGMGEGEDRRLEVTQKDGIVREFPNGDIKSARAITYK